jgi:hypothetical protein
MVGNAVVHNLFLGAQCYGGAHSFLYYTTYHSFMARRVFAML